MRFSHALVRDALEADLTRLRLARMHSRLGRSLIALGSDDVTATAHHLLRAAAVVTADAGPAVHHARLACEQAVRRYAPQNAEALLNTALGLLTDQPAAFADQDPALLRVMLLGQLVDCRIRMGAVVPARDAQQQAVRVARAEGRADLLTAAYTTWTEPTPWRVRPYAACDPEAVEELTNPFGRHGRHAQREQRVEVSAVPDGHLPARVPVRRGERGQETVGHPETVAAQRFQRRAHAGGAAGVGERTELGDGESDAHR
ncbi:hypothetical protein [Streptomyces sp. KS 21]|uniref:hypothetical protein n=1 Tax=Streptomyces sp. KS 21 TaxID=2485150 RepID=UPI001414D995|nr:hypothetical protein [Streptomyces sp. KS 21]